jgi:hypothetical protein
MATRAGESAKRTEDLLSAIDVVLTCSKCDATYSIPASFVRESQRILAEGCTGSSPFECNASFYANLIDPQVIAELERAWVSFQQSASSHGGIGVDLPRSDADSHAIAPDARALERWENEGGQCKHVRAELAEVHRQHARSAR